MRVIAGYTAILTLTRPTLYAARWPIGKLWRVVRSDAADVAAAFPAWPAGGRVLRGLMSSHQGVTVDRPRSDHQRSQSRHLLAASFDAGRVAAVRHYVGVLARGCGLGRSRGDEFVAAVNEILTNAVRHGGGCGELRLWLDGQLVCEVSDRGDGFDSTRYAERIERPLLTAAGGKGLWIAQRLTDGMSITSGRSGTTVQVRAKLPLPQ